MTTVLYYTRYSSSKQHGKSSIPRQIHLCEQYRLKHSLAAPNHIYTDKGASAYHSRQLSKELGQLIQDLEAGIYKKPVVVLCEDLDRISRAGINESQEIFSRITKHADLVTVSDGKTYTYDDNSLEINLIKLVRASLAHDESDKKSKRAKEYWEACREQGIAQNSVCPKYLILNKDKKTYSVREEIAEEIRGIYQLLRVGYGLKRVHQDFPSWSPTSIARLRKDERIVDFGIISKEDFWKVKSTLTTTRKAGGKNSKNLFRSLFICGECGANLVYVSPRSSRPTWSGHLTCKNRQSKGKASCPKSNNINYNKFEPIFLNLLTSISSELFNTNSADIEASKSLLETLNMEHSDLLNRYDLLIDNFDSPSLRMKKKVEEIESQLDNLEAQRDQLLTEINGFENEIEFELPTTDSEREDFNTKLLHAFKSITLNYPTEQSNWYTFDNKFAISGDYCEWELLHDDDYEPVTLEFDTK